MSDSSVSWKQTFSDLFNHAVEKYRQGHQRADGMVDSAGQKFLSTIGYTEQEFFDFVEDFSKDGQPTPEVALEVAAVRRDYFLNVQKGVASSRRISMSDLPAKDSAMDGIVWLPRLLPKAEAKLRGEMPPDLMYGCGGDRRFFRNHGIDPAEFLRRVWKAEGDPAPIVSWIKSSEHLPVS